MVIWQYIHGFAGRAKPEAITFFDQHDQTLYRDLSIHTIGQHGWELVTVNLVPDPKTGELRYEYFFKRQREDAKDDGVATHRRN
ncbi:MAG: hypothetical protein KGO50_00975 [Myxococcales bacterium]|jgi:hypothetical protein|nr:hypothetical protein [Myxococcales bacterium]